MIAATNRPDLLDESILSSGKFEKRVFLGIMNDKGQRRQILQSHLRHYQLEDCTLEEVEEISPLNVTGADFYQIVVNAV